MSRPLISAGFGYDAFALSSPVREFYERWHAQGGQSARDHCGLMRRAANYRDVRNEQDRRQWEELDWKLRQCSARLRLQEIARQLQEDKKIVKFGHSQR